MYVAIDDTALRIIRSLRCQWATFALPHRETPTRSLVLKPGDPDPAHSGNYEYRVSEDDSFELLGQTLRDCDEQTPRDDLDVLRLNEIVANTHFDFSPIGNLGEFSEERPCRLGVFKREQHVRRKKLQVSLLSPNLPVESIVLFNRDIAFASPELCVIQLASHLDAISLAQVIMEFCGTYAVSPTDDAAFYDRQTEYGVEPVMSLASLKAMSDAIRMWRGRDVLRRAMAMSREGAASPSEANVGIVMGLPMDAGGYDLGFPEFNVKLELDELQSSHVLQHTYYLDAFWPDCLADMEYDSVSFHLDPAFATSTVERDRWRLLQVEKADADRLRSRELQLLGLEVIPVTKIDFQKLARMDQVAWSLAVRRHRVDGMDLEEFQNDLERRSNWIARAELPGSLRRSGT